MKTEFSVVDSQTGLRKTFKDVEKAVNYKQNMEIADRMNGFDANYIVNITYERD